MSGFQGSSRLLFAPVASLLIGIKKKRWLETRKKLNRTLGSVRRRELGTSWIMKTDCRNVVVMKKNAKRRWVSE